MILIIKNYIYITYLNYNCISLVLFELIALFLGLLGMWSEEPSCHDLETKLLR